MPEGTVLAFDFGEKRIGVATGETLLASAHPLAVIRAESNDDRFAAIKSHYERAGRDPSNLRYGCVVPG